MKLCGCPAEHCGYHEQTNTNMTISEHLASAAAHDEREHKLDSLTTLNGNTQICWTYPKTNLHKRTMNKKRGCFLHGWLPLVVGLLSVVGFILCWLLVGGWLPLLVGFYLWLASENPSSVGFQFWLASHLCVVCVKVCIRCVGECVCVCGVCVCDVCVCV